MVMRGVQIVRGTSAVQAAPTSPLEIGIIGTTKGKPAGTNFGQAYTVHSVAEAETRFGNDTDGTPARHGTIVEAMQALQDHVSIPVHAVAIDVSAGLDASGVRTAINNAVAQLPTTCTYIGAPNLTVNFNAQDEPLATVCPTVATLNSRAVAIDAIAVTDVAWDNLTNALAYLGEAGNKGSRTLPIVPRVVRGDGIPHAGSATAMAAMARNEIEVGAQRLPSNIPVYGVVRQEVEMLRSRTDNTAAVNRIRDAGGTVIAWSGADFRMYGGIMLTNPPTAPERFVSVRRVVDIAENRLETALGVYEDENLVGDSLDTIIDAADGELSRMQGEGMFGGFTIAPNAAYNTQTNLAAGNVGIAVTLDVFTPIGLIQVLLNLSVSVPA